MKMMKTGSALMRGVLFVFSAELKRFTFPSGATLTVLR
jgi:hypothetical protein